jgi:hypothetical protein
MASRDVHLDPRDTHELADLLGFLGDWFASQHPQQLTEELHRCAGNNAYDLDTLQADLTRFAFLLGADSELFGPNPT